MKRKAREEVCPECKNTNGEHLLRCSRYPGRHDPGRRVVRGAAVAMLTVALAGCNQNRPDHSPQRAVITSAYCNEEKGAEDCWTAIRYADGTVGIRGRLYGEVGDSLVAWPCEGSDGVARTWCSYPVAGGTGLEP